MKNASPIGIVIGLGVLAGSAAAHNHVTVDTAGGKIVVRAGYYPSEAAYGFNAAGELTLSGSAAVYSVPDTLTGGAFDGWYGGDDLLLTSDFYFATGRLAGGDFRYELAISAVSGPSSVIAWGLFAGTTLSGSASSDVATRADRSYDVGLGNHFHGQGFAIRDAGLYRVTLTAWDGNGVYADADPVTFLVQTAPAPGAGLVAGLAGLMAARRRR